MLFFFFVIDEQICFLRNLDKNIKVKMTLYKKKTNISNLSGFLG